MVIYSGHDTKIMQNKSNMRHKITACERSLNAFTVYIMALNMSIILGLAIMGAYYFEEQRRFHWYIFWPAAHSDSDSILLYSTIRFFSYFILLNTIIPISLLISLDMAKFFQSTMMSHDQNMSLPHFPFRVQNTLVNEDLGAIQYVFSDKTGTLTDNSMEFKRCTIQSMDFRRPELLACCQSFQSLNQHMQLNYPDYDCHQFIDMFVCMLINNEVIYDPMEEKDSKLSGSSPDEVALVQFCFQLNLRFSKKNKKGLTLNLFERDVPYDILTVIPFDSDRKRMSVVAKNRETD